MQPYHPPTVEQWAQQQKPEGQKSLGDFDPRVYHALLGRAGLAPDVGAVAAPGPKLLNPMIMPGPKAQAALRQWGVKNPGDLGHWRRANEFEPAGAIFPIDQAPVAPPKPGPMVPPPGQLKR